MHGRCLKKTFPFYTCNYNYAPKLNVPKYKRLTTKSVCIQTINVDTHSKFCDSMDLILINQNARTTNFFITINSGFLEKLQSEDKGIPAIKKYIGENVLVLCHLPPNRNKSSKNEILNICGECAYHKEHSYNL